MRDKFSEEKLKNKVTKKYYSIHENEQTLMDRDKIKTSENNDKKILNTLIVNLNKYNYTNISNKE